MTIHLNRILPFFFLSNLPHANFSYQPGLDRSSNFPSPLHDHAYDCSQIQSVGRSRQHGDKPIIGGALRCMVLL
jgi:hypothetical protein